MALLTGLAPLGALLHVGGSVMIVYGQTLVKVGHLIAETSVAGASWTLPARGGESPKWRRPDGRWRRQRAGSRAVAAAGWAAFAAGNAARFVSMRFASQTVLSGLGSLQFAVIPAASRHLLGVRPRAPALAGVATVLAGNAFIILYGPPERGWTLPRLRARWAAPETRALLAAAAAALAGAQALWRRMHADNKRAAAERAAIGALAEHLLDLRRHAHAALGLAGADGGGGAGGAEPPAARGAAPPAADAGEALLARVRRRSADGAPPLGAARGGDGLGVPHTFARALLFSLVASLVGAWSVLFSKSLTYVASGAPASLADPYSWACAAGFGATAAVWVRKSDSGLRLYPATLIMPLMQAFWMVVSLVTGAVYFDEVAALSGRQVGLLAAGLAMALVGALSMGLEGFLTEGDAAGAGAPGAAPPGAPLLPPPPPHAHKSSGPPPPEAAEAGLVEMTGRVEGLSSPHERRRAGLGAIEGASSGALTG